ncbi:MAG: murein biosynthesis integral membrane protein MurJ [Melioribacteraceae bacterium]
MLKKWLPGFIGLSALALLGRLLGLIREVLMASKFGANEITDAYLTTLLLFDIAMAANSSILSGTLSYSTQVKNLVNFPKSLLKVGLIALSIVLLIALVFYPFADKLIPLIFSKSAETTQIIIDASRLLLFLAAFLVAGGVFSALLQMKGDITNPGRLVIFLNVTSIVFLIFFSKYLGIISLPLGLFLGGILFFIYQIILIQKTNKDFTDNSVKDKFNMFGWGAVILLVFGNSLLPSISGLLERYFAYSFVEGTFSHYQYAAKIILLPLTIFSFAISTSLLPIQTKFISEKNDKEFMNATNNGILFSVVTSSFFVLLFSTLSEPIIQLIYQHGHFTIHDSTETSHALRIMSVGLIPFLLNPVLANIFYSLRTVKNLIAINLFFIVIQIAILFFLSRIISGIETLTLTWAIIVWANNCALIFYLENVRKIRFDRTIALKLLIIILTTAVLILLSKNIVGLWFVDMIAQNSWLLLIKVVSAGIILLLIFFLGVYLIFRDTLSKVFPFLKRDTE